MANQIIHDYLKIQNRPYSVNDIVSNLQNEYGKSIVQKAVDALVNDGRVFEKTYDKQKVYCITQEMKQDVKDLMKMDKELEAHANEVETKRQERESEIKKEEAILLNLKSLATMEDLVNEERNIMETIKTLSTKLDKLMESTTSENLPESKKKAQKDLDEFSKEYKKRKRQCMEMIDCILENYPGSKQAFYEEVGVDPQIVQ